MIRAMSKARIGVVGTGRMGANMARHLKDQGYAVTAVYDAFPKIAADLASEIGSTAASTLAEVTAAAERAVAVGVPRDAVLIDPTHDFGKNTYHGLSLLRHVKDLVKTGWPVLMALSNKDFVGETLGVGLSERLEGTLAATALAAADGAAMFRVHEVGPTRRVLEMVASIQGVRSPTRTVRGLA